MLLGLGYTFQAGTGERAKGRGQNAEGRTSPDRRMESRARCSGTARVNRADKTAHLRPLACSTCHPRRTPWV